MISATAKDIWLFGLALAVPNVWDRLIMKFGPREHFYPASDRLQRRYYLRVMAD